LGIKKKNYTFESYQERQTKKIMKNLNNINKLTILIEYQLGVTNPSIDQLLAFGETVEDINEDFQDYLDNQTEEDDEDDENYCGSPSNEELRADFQQAAGF